MKISNSEMDTKQRCDLQYTFGHSMNLEPKSGGSPAIQQGNYGHFLLQIYFKARFAGLNHADARQTTMETHIRTAIDIADPDVTSAALGIVIPFLDSWFEVRPFQVVHVEEAFYYDLEPDQIYAFTPDLVVEVTDGQYKGEHIVIDWKFTGQFWSRRAVRLMQQLPKYGMYLQKLKGYNIKRTYLIQFNTRKNRSEKSDAFRVEPIELLNEKKMARVHLENTRMFQEVAEWKSLPIEEQLEKGNRALHVKTCDFCFFSNDLCPALLEGRPTKTIIAANYRDRDYGYRD